MKLRHSKHSTDDVEADVASASSATSASSGSTNNWKCPSCGAENEDFRKFCDGCGDKRPGANVASKGISMEDLLGPESSTDTPSTLEPEDDTSAKAKKDKKSKKSSQDSDEDQSFEPAKLEPSSAASQWFDTGKDHSTDDFESSSSPGSTNDSDSKPSFVVSGPEPSAPSDENLSAPEPLTFSQQSSAPSPQTSGQNYYIVFVNTPAASLIKTRVLLEFGDFPTITIGRSPENVVVIPDPEVSRKHASLSINGSSLSLKDLGSSNGTFVYNGKEFERVSGSANVGPNTVLKFGTGTIVKLVSE